MNFALILQVQGDVAVPEFLYWWGMMGMCVAVEWQIKAFTLTCRSAFLQIHSIRRLCFSILNPKAILFWRWNFILCQDQISPSPKKLTDFSFSKSEVFAFLFFLFRNNKCLCVSLDTSTIDNTINGSIRCTSFVVPCCFLRLQRVSTRNVRPFPSYSGCLRNPSWR